MGRAIGNYRVVQKLGEGGMGAVYKLQHSTLPNTFKAMKTMLRASSDAALLRFQQEAGVAPIVGTERVVKVDDYGTFPDGTAYIVMEFCDGGDLAGYLATNGPLPIESALKLLYRVADTLGVAHSKGIVHRDLKPANIMLERGTLRPKIADWGVSRASGEGKLAHTEERAIIGTPGYMSPESALGLATDGRTDIFSLGVILYELLTGQLPFPATMPTSAMALFNDFLARPAPTIASTRPPTLERAPEIVEALVHRAVAKDVGDRFATMVAFRDEIARCLEWLASNSGGVPRIAMATMLSAHADSSGPHPTVRAQAGEVAALIERFATPTPRPSIDGRPVTPPVTGSSAPAPTAGGKRWMLGGAIAIGVIVVLSAVSYPLFSRPPTSAPALDVKPAPAVEPAIAPPAEGRVLISTTPIGAQVVVDGKLVGESPVIVSGKPGETKQVHLSMPGYQDRDESVVIASEDHKTAIQMIPVPAAPTGKPVKSHTHETQHKAATKPTTESSKPKSENAVNPWQ